MQLCRVLGKFQEQRGFPSVAPGVAQDLALERFGCLYGSHGRKHPVSSRGCAGALLLPCLASWPLRSGPLLLSRVSCSVLLHLPCSSFPS